MRNWVICAGSKQAGVIATYLKSVMSDCSCAFESDAWKLRSALKVAPLKVSVAVGEGALGPDAVNIAAALVQDACAQEVVLFVQDASGSLRSRAKRAGISRVLSALDLGITSFSGKHQSAHDDANAHAASAAGSSSQVRTVPNGDLDASHLTLPAAKQALPAAKQNDTSLSTIAETNQKWTGFDTSTQNRAAISQVIPEIGEIEPLQKRKDVPVITFVSGRGGVGKTTLCALAGHIAASWGMKVALLDLDLAFGNLGVLCGSERMADIAGFLGDGNQAAVLDKDGLAACASQVSENLAVYGPCRAPEYAELVQPYAEQIIAALTHMYDLVLVDTTNNWNDAVASAAQMSDRLAIVTDERPGAIPALARCGGLAVRLGVARTRMVRIMNGCDPRQRDEAFVARGASGLECSREIRVFDGELEAIELLNCGRSRELLDIANPMATSLAAGLAQLLRELGCLPESESAQNALRGPRKARRIFGRKKQVSSV